MFRYISSVTYNTCSLYLRQRLCSRPATEKWDLLAAVCVERKPVITPVLNDLEQRYKNLQMELEYEQSLKSDHEIRDEKDKKQQESLTKGEDLDMILKETAQDFLDACTEELSQFEFGSRITEDDTKNNFQSLNRKLDKHLVLLVKQTLGKDNLFILPQGLRLVGETLRQTAERVMKELCGTEIKVQFYSNAPSGFYKYKYPRSIQDETKAVGAKIFMYAAKYKSGKLNEGLDFKWLDRVELNKEVKPNYCNSVTQFLVDDT